MAKGAGMRASLGPAYREGSRPLRNLTAHPTPPCHPPSLPQGPRATSQPQPATTSSFQPPLAGGYAALAQPASMASPTATSIPRPSNFHQTKHEKAAPSPYRRRCRRLLKYPGGLGAWPAQRWQRGRPIAAASERTPGACPPRRCGGTYQRTDNEVRTELAVEVQLAPDIR